MRRRNVHRADQEAASATPEQLQRRAELIAEGRDRFPEDVPRPERDCLLRMVRQLLRDRLLAHVVRAIADDLHSAKPSE